MLRPSIVKLLLLLGTADLAVSSQGSDAQVVFAASTDTPKAANHDYSTKEAQEHLLRVANAHTDPVDAYLALRPEAAAELAEPRLLQVLGEEPEWMTVGDKMRLRRKGKKFMDVTEYQDMYDEQLAALAGKAKLPELTHQRLVKPLLPQISTGKMHDVLKHMTGYYNRFYGGVIGEHSAQWLHDHIAEIIAESPFHTHISLEFFTHVFPQPSIIARFEPKVRNWTHPLTILGAHQDSANYNFPLLPAPGADDDCSGTVSILEAFRVLAHNGYIPQDGPVEFHWYAAEEGGLLGSQAIARYKKDSNAKIGAMMEFDMTAYVARNATESIGFIKTQSDMPLTEWALKLAKEYISIDSDIYELSANAGSDYMSYTKLNYPATFASEGNPLAGGFPGDMDPYVHTTKDTMDVDDELGYFSIEHMARFSELAIAFVIEQAGWDNKWR
ncbi:putative Peptide hydrolase [Seiridium cardinale]